MTKVIPARDFWPLTSRTALPDVIESINAFPRYNRGLTDYLNVVDAQRQFYELQEQYATAQVTQAEQFVQLYKSLGGGWENYQSVPAIRRPQPAILAALRRVLESSEPKGNSLYQISDPNPPK